MLLTILFDLHSFINSLTYSVLGIFILVGAFYFVEVVLTPKHDLWREIVEKNNTALAIVAGLFMLSISIIIASAIH